MRRFVCWALVFISGALFQAGCLHAPPAGATRGVVEIKNMHIWENPVKEQNTGVLTGVVIGPNTVLTSAHAFLYDPAPGHPLLIDNRIVDYSIIADGWAGKRGGREIGDKSLDDELLKRDFLLLRTKEAFSEYAVFDPIPFERLDEFKNATVVARLKETGQAVAIPLKKILVGTQGDFMFAKLPSKLVDTLYVSGSPLIGTDQDGNLVLLGVASGYGTIYFDRFVGRITGKDYIYFTPAYLIPFDELTAP